METNKLIDRLRELSKIGIVNYKHDTPVLIEAADRIEELDERIAIMQESMEELEQREPVRHGHWIEYPRCLAYDGAFSDDHIVCSVCESVWNVLDNCTERFDCCPHCGAKMDEVTP